MSNPESFNRGNEPSNDEADDFTSWDYYGSFDDWSKNEGEDEDSEGNVVVENSKGDSEVSSSSSIEGVPIDEEDSAKKAEKDEGGAEVGEEGEDDGWNGTTNRGDLEQLEPESKKELERRQGEKYKDEGIVKCEFSFGRKGGETVEEYKERLKKARKWMTEALVMSEGVDKKLEQGGEDAELGREDKFRRNRLTIAAVMAKDSDVLGWEDCKIDETKKKELVEGFDALKEDEFKARVENICRAFDSEDGWIDKTVFEDENEFYDFAMGLKKEAAESVKQHRAQKKKRASQRKNNKSKSEKRNDKEASVSASEAKAEVEAAEDVSENTDTFIFDFDPEKELVVEEGGGEADNAVEVGENSRKRVKSEAVGGEGGSDGSRAIIVQRRRGKAYRFKGRDDEGLTAGQSTGGEYGVEKTVDALDGGGVIPGRSERDETEELKRMDVDIRKSGYELIEKIENRLAGNGRGLAGESSEPAKKEVIEIDEAENKRILEENSGKSLGDVYYSAVNGKPYYLVLEMLKKAGLDPLFNGDGDMLYSKCFSVKGADGKRIKVFLKFQEEEE